MQTITLKEAAEMELLGAERRLARAQQAYRDFVCEHGQSSLSPEMRASLEREREMLLVEIDSASRQLQHCQELFREARQESDVWAQGESQI